MRSTLLLAFLAAATAAPALAQPARNSGDNQTFTVTGRRIADYRAALAACLARRCPVNEDVDATLALAEVEFEAGDYHQSRRDIAASLGRNRHQASAFPESVSDLYRARARVARHLGRDDEAVRASFDILGALRDGLPEEDYRHWTARLEIAEMMMVTRRYEAAQRELDTLADHARAAGRTDVASAAELRSTWLAYLLAPHNHQPRNRLLAMSNETGPDGRMRATGAKILLARIYRDDGETARSDALIAEVASNNRERRDLIYAPDFQLNQFEHVREQGVANGNTRIPDNFEGQWIDVGFWVQPDGHVQDLDIIRRSGTPDWADPLLRSIRGRIYSQGTEPTFRLERYTYTAPFEMATGTRMPVRSPNARVEYYDLSTGQPPPEDVIPARPPSALSPAPTPAA